jgi:hypothetical protein
LLKKDYEEIKKQVYNASLDIHYNSSEISSKRLVFSGKKNEIFFSCYQCSKIFLSKKGIEDHESVHDKEISQLDDIQIKYYEKCSDIRTQNFKDQSQSKKTIETIRSEPLIQGFAIKNRKVKRFTPEQKEYLKDLFDQDENDKKNKARPSAVEADMINRFSEGLSERQITSYFSRLSSNKKNKKSSEYSEKSSHNDTSKEKKKKKLNEKEFYENESELDELNKIDKTHELSKRYGLRKRMTREILKEIDSDEDDMINIDR